MTSKKLIKILLIATLIFMFCVAGASAKTNEKTKENWNVSNGLDITKDFSDNQDYYKEGDDYSFRIVWGSDAELQKFKNGFTKEENGMYKHDDASASEYNNTYGVYSSCAYGEYVKIGNTKYWIEAQQDTVQNAKGTDKIGEYKNFNTEKLIGYLTYFNEHNNATIIDI